MGTIDYRSQVAAQAEKSAAKQKAAANDLAWREIIDRYAIRDNEANRGMVETYSNGVISLEKFKYLVRNMPQGFTLVWSTEKVLKAELIDQIFEYSSRDGSVPEYSKSSMAGWSLGQLRDRLDEVCRRIYFKQFPADALKTAIAKERVAQEKNRYYFDRSGGKHPRLGSVTVPPGWVSATSTSAYLRQANPIQLQHYLGKYAGEQVNFYLNS